MNHDRVHCANYSDDCPKGCFRGELVRDLKRMHKDRWDSSASFADLEGTDGCLKGVITAEDWEKAVKNVEFFVCWGSVFLATISIDTTEEKDQRNFTRP